MMNKCFYCLKCGEELMTSEESFELWPTATFDGRGLEFDYLCWNCGFGYQKEEFTKRQKTAKKKKNFSVGRHGEAITTHSPKFSLGLSSREQRGRSLRQRAARKTQAPHERSEIMENAGVGADGREPLGEPRQREK